MDSEVGESDALRPLSAPSHIPAPPLTPQSRKLNDAVYELHAPSLGSPDLDVVFFHGLQLQDYYQAYTETWLSAKGDECWPQTWLSRDLPRARILSVSYDSSAIRGAKQGNMDLEATGEGLVDSLIHQAGIGQTNPVILVGHSLGGLVIKQVCLKAESIYMSKPAETSYLHNFLKNLRGTFFFATPHHGSRLASIAAYLPWYPSTMLKYLTFLNEKTESLNENFCELRKKYHWNASGVGEARAVFLPGLSRGLIIVPDESARSDMDYFAQLDEDHITICKPKGQSCSSYRHFISFVLGIVDKVHRCEGVPLHAAGLHSQVEKVVQLLETSRSVAIVGMAGIGTTSIAKAVFNTLSYDFEYTCVVDSVKSFSTFEELERQILGSLYHHGENVNNCDGDWSILKGKRLLLLMDDVNSGDQVRPVIDAGCLAPSSRVVITARHEMGDLDVGLGKVSIYSARSLNYQAAKKVFCHHAFGQPKVPGPLVNLKGFVKQVVSNCAGLPLLLEVMGCHFRRPKYGDYREDPWKVCINGLKEAEALEGNAEEMLIRKLSFRYEVLGAQERSMFLDVATIFSCWPVDNIRAVWSTSYEQSEIGFSTLLTRGLIKLARVRPGQDEIAYTHSVLGDLGRRLALESEYRIFDYGQEKEDVPSPINLGKERKQLKCLMLSRWRSSWGSGLNVGSLSQMADLRFLALKNVPVSGSCENLPTGLTLLQWRVTSPSRLELSGLSHLTRIAILDLDARAQMHQGNLDCMAETLGDLQELRFLHFQGSFARLPDNFGNLRFLKYCNLSSDSRLKSLPESFGLLSSLEELVVSDTGLEYLPESFGDLFSLRRLRLECFRLRALPDSFSQLFSLVALHLFCCPELRSFPSAFGDLDRLELLEINVCSKLEELPDSFGQLKSLKKLRISYCNSLIWPSQLGPLPSLAELEIVGCQTLPGQLGQLPSLKEMLLSEVEARELPQSMRELEGLRLLRVRRCSFMPAWHLQLQEMGWTGFYQRLSGEGEKSPLEAFVYLRGAEAEPAEELQRTANRIMTRDFPHVSRWQWATVREVGPELKTPDKLVYGRSFSQFYRR